MSASLAPYQAAEKQPAEKQAAGRVGKRKQKGRARDSRPSRVICLLRRPLRLCNSLRQFRARHCYLLSRSEVLEGERARFNFVFADDQNVA